MSATSGDGLDAANDQPAKTLKKRTIDFIARCRVTASNDAVMYVLAVVLPTQGVLMALVVLGVLK